MGKGTSKVGGGSGNLTGEALWNKKNEETAEAFDKWLDGKDKGAFEADEYNVYEKLTLSELQKHLKPDSEKGFSYNDGDEVPEDNWWHIEYQDGSTVNLEPYDSLKGVKRSNILLAVNDNANTTMIYSKRGSSDISIYNDSNYGENNDIWRWRRN